MKKRVIFLAFLLVVGISFSTAAFTDLKTDHWAYRALTELQEQGILEGYPDGEFKGAKKISRYEMAVLVDRAHQRVKELEQFNSLTEAEAQVTKEIASEEILVVDISERKLSSGQLEDIKLIVDNLRIEFAQELEVLGIEVENLSTEIAALEAKLAELKVPKDKIEFGAVITTNFETTDYPSNEEERALAVYTWTDEDVLDLDVNEYLGDMDYADVYHTLLADYMGTDIFGKPNDFPLKLDYFDSSDDVDDIPTRKKFWQEYDFTIKGQQDFGNFNLELETIDNLFSKADGFNDYSQPEQKALKMDKALLSFNYHDNYFKIGDLDDYQLKPYFLAENDLEALEYRRNYKGIDWKFLTGGAELDLAGFNFPVDVYSLNTAKEINSALYEASFNQLRYEGQALSNLALAFDNFKFNDSLSLKGELVYNDWELEDLGLTFLAKPNMYYIGFEELLKNKKGNDYYLDLEADWKINDRFKLKPRYQSVGDEFLAVENDLDAPYGFDLYGLGFDYSLTDNLILESSYAYLDPDSEWDKVFKGLVFAPGVKPEAKEIYKLGLKQQKKRFVNSLALEYEKNDNFFADFEQLTLILKTIYQLDAKTQLGAKFVNKFGNWDSRVINQSTEYKTEMEAGYNYLEAFINKRLRENLSWNLTGRITDSDSSYKQNNVQGYDIDAVASMLETSLRLEF
jgi:hypothetical protein